MWITAPEGLKISIRSDLSVANNQEHGRAVYNWDTTEAAPIFHGIDRGPRCTPSPFRLVCPRAAGCLLR